MLLSVSDDLNPVCAGEALLRIQTAACIACDIVGHGGIIEVEAVQKITVDCAAVVRCGVALKGAVAVILIASFCFI